ncbi:bifunctional lytic transglycosylase/C40 family peptidase [Streptomyces sp. NPDC048606]|uniref:C40 family peptidase n=1 Tax=Streptomyces sp. NPDC048606 TaxID=3154726 RepID=UPI0034492FEC
MRALVGAAVVALGGLLLPLAACVGVGLLDSDARAAGAAGGSGAAGLRNVPAAFRSWILAADADCPRPELTPALLASQLWRESRFETGRARATSRAGAQGPAQFMPGTWSTWGRDADGNGRASPWDVGDAVTAQGRMMCSLLGDARSSGFGGDPRALALAGYNAGWGRVVEFRGVPPRWFAGGETYAYVRAVLAGTARFGFEGPRVARVPREYGAAGAGAGVAALRRAEAWRGTPYAWGGGSPAGPSTGFCDGINGYLRGACVARSTVGFDCSSLVRYAYWPSRRLPRVASAQYAATSGRTVSRGELRPGDLLFWSRGGADGIYHVALYAGDGNVLHAPRTGREVDVEPLASAMPPGDWFGATRP